MGRTINLISQQRRLVRRVEVVQSMVERGVDRIARVGPRVPGEGDSKIS
jgi:DNA repair photolyase